MGSRKKLVLASLVSLMMALAFVIGLVPDHATLGARAASGSGGRIDMVDLLNAVLDLKSEKDIALITVSDPRSGAIIKVPTDTIQASLALRAVTLGGDGVAGNVAYGIDGTWGGEAWVGDWFSGVANVKPYRSAIDLVPVIDGAAEGVQVAHYIYAFAGATVLPQGLQAEITYTVRSGGPYDEDGRTPKQIWLEAVSPTVDNNKNGIPDDIVNAVFDGETWLVTYRVPLLDDLGVEIGEAIRQTVVASLDDLSPGKSSSVITVSPDPFVSVTAPTSNSLLSAGMLVAGETAYVIVSVVDDLKILLTSANGAVTPAALNAWGNAVSGKAPSGGLITLASPAGAKRYVAISLVAAKGDGTFRELNGELPEGMSIDVDFRGLDIPGDGDVQLSAYPVKLVKDPSTGYEFTNVGAAQDAVQYWELKAVRNPALANQDADEFLASLTSASAVLAPYKATMAIDSLTPEAGAVKKQTATVIRGEFGAVLPMTPEQVAAAYAVYFGSWPTPAVVGPAGLVLEKAGQAMQVYAPPITAPGFVDVTVVSLVSPSDMAVKSNGFKYQYQLTRETIGSGIIDVSPTPDDFLYDPGSSVDLLATAAAGYTFREWQIDKEGVIETITNAATTVIMDSNVTATAIFDANQFTLTTSVTPPGSGTITKDPDQETYALNSVVNLTATAVAGSGYTFKQWELDASGTTPTTSVVMTGNKNVRAVFEVAPLYNLTIVISPDGAGNVVADIPGPYLAGTDVTLTATPNPGYTFSSWTGAVPVPGNPTSATVTMVADTTVTANFVPSLPGQVTLTTLVSPAGTGTVTPPGQTLWDVGSTVDLVAAANAGYVFDYWAGNVANTLSPETTIYMAQNETVTANFRPLTTWTVTLLSSIGGHVEDEEGTTVDPGVFENVPDGTEVTLVAVAESGYSFVEWQDGAGNRLSGNATYTFVVNSNLTIKPYFAYNQTLINSITPDSAWLFGGVVAKIEGQGFKPTTTLTFNGQPITGADKIKITPTVITFVVPPLADILNQTSLDEKPASAPSQVTDAQPSTSVPVVVSSGPDPGDTASTDFVYKRYEVGLDSVVTTAFHVTYNSKAGTKYIPFALDATAGNLGIFPTTTNGADFILPLPNTPPIGSYYGLIRAAKRTKTGTTYNPSPLLTERIDSVAGAKAKPVDNAWDFSVHFYKTTPNTVALQAGLNQTGAAAGFYDEVGAWLYNRGATSGKIAFPTADTALTVETMAKGVTMWATETLYDYGAQPAAEQPGSTLNTPYQSTLLRTEYVTGTGTDARKVKQLTARVYDFSAFSLRMGRSAIESAVNQDNVTYIEGQTDAEPTGGSLLRIRSLNGGLAWTRVGFHRWTTSKAGETAATEYAIVKQWDPATGQEIEGGRDEFEIYVRIPKFPDSEVEAGTKAGVSIYAISDLFPNTDDLTGNPDGTATPILVMKDPVTYKASPVGPNILPILLALAALIAAIATGIWIASQIGEGEGEGEGEGGGGGGGPCFIATAAYGTPMAAQIGALRVLRDTVLLGSGIGTAFVEGYYQVSPYIADIVAKSPVLAAMVRVALAPIVMMSQVAVAAPVWTISLGVAGIAILIARRALRRKA